MHSEQFSISLNTLNNIYQNIDNKKIVAVGTTSVRTLESLYYLGVQCVKAGVDSWTPAPVQQWDPYNNELEISSKEALGALITYMEKNGLNELVTKTRIIIVPSYKFKIVNMLVTNFHQPQSTLLLLIAAFIGEDWRKVYQHAMDNDFRFLSYGDSSLLIP
jgi:S-adenosylmethionine:tRNA ribosyltransferase-isomerase